MINKYNLRLCFSQHMSHQITEESRYSADSDSAGLGEGGNQLLGKAHAAAQQGANVFQSPTWAGVLYKR